MKQEETILIMEDDPSVMMPLADILESEGYSVLRAENGSKGVQLAKAEKPELIVSDIMMPEMDGMEAFEELQKDPHTAVIPFIFLTANWSQISTCSKE